MVHISDCKCHRLREEGGEGEGQVDRERERERKFACWRVCACMHA